MTLHSAKGLEFPVVVITGMEDGVFPHLQSMGDPDEMEEERRLCYVGITRAQRHLYLTHAEIRTLWGSSQYNTPSRFLAEIPSHLVRDLSPSRKDRRRRAGGSWGTGSWERSGRHNDHDEPAGRVFGGGRRAVVEAALRGSAEPPPPTGAEKLDLRVGDEVRHSTFGEGVVLDLAGAGEKAEAVVRFRDVGEKRLLLSWAPLERVS
jgi:DNA helicase-2/ATP-dependent DNA helicase PcrA